MTGLCVENLTYSYGAKPALSDLSFVVEAGQFCALLGPNGAGKSTLFALLTRLFVAPQGQITIAGQSLAHHPRQALKQMGVVFQQPTLDLDLSAQRNLRYFAALHGITGRDADRRIDCALDQLDMRQRASETVRHLNGGHRRRLEIARSLLHSPKVLLLDEPTVGLDAATRTSITDHIHQLVATQGLTVLWATHLTDEIHDDDQLLVLDHGQLKQSGRTGALRRGQPLQQHFLTLTGAAA